jgi:hypothetical protein
VEEVHRGLIALLHSQSGPGPVIPELWTYNKHGSYRYFRIVEAGLVELDSCGNVPAADEPGACPVKGGSAGRGGGVA